MAAKVAIRCGRRGRPHRSDSAQPREPVKYRLSPGAAPVAACAHCAALLRTLMSYLSCGPPQTRAKVIPSPALSRPMHEKGRRHNEVDKGCLPVCAKSNGCRWITFRKQSSINNLLNRKNGSFRVKYFDFKTP
jgi:hypothetical protein